MTVTRTILVTVTVTVTVTQTQKRPLNRERFCDIDKDTASYFDLDTNLDSNEYQEVKHK